MLKLRGYLYVTDVFPRFETDDFDADGCWRRYHENLIEKIPLYSKEGELNG